MSYDDGRRLPAGWASTTLGGICTRPQYGWTTRANHDRGRLRLLRTTDITSGEINWATVPFCTDDPADPEKYLVSPGDLFVSRAGSVGASILVQHVSEPTVFASYLIRFRPSSFVDAGFIAYFMQGSRYWSAISEKSAGIALPNVNARKLEAIDMPLAPANEQRRIVDKIDELFSDLDAGVAALERVRRNLKRYRASVLKAAVEGKLTETWRAEHPDVEPARKLLNRILKERRHRWEADQLAAYKAKGKRLPNGWKERYKAPTPPDTTNLPDLPEGWCWVTLDQVIVFGPQNGLYKPKSAYGSGTPIIRIDDYQDGWHRPYENLRKLQLSEEELETYGLLPNDLLLNRVNSMTHLGKCLIVSDALRPCVFESNIMRTGIAEWVDVRWVDLCLRSLSGRKRLIARAKQAVNQASINQADVVMTPLPLPPAAEQAVSTEVVQLSLSTADAAHDIVEASVRRSDRLRQSILKRAFEGRLVPQDANDEPASVLLDRIREQREHAARSSSRARKPCGRRKGVKARRSKKRESAA